MENQRADCQSHPRLFILSGASGVGKDTVAHLLLERRPASFYFVVTATTREPREGEVHGQDYFFVSHDEFMRMVSAGEMLEHAEVYGQLKGIPKQHIQAALDSGRDVLLRVDVQGAATVRTLVREAISIFLQAESDEALFDRLRNRESDTPEALAVRIDTAQDEMGRMIEFDYCVVNPEGRPEAAVEQILKIVDSSHARVGQHPIKL